MNKTGLFRHRRENGILNVTQTANTVKKTQGQEKRSHWLMTQNPLRITVLKDYNVVPNTAATLNHECLTISSEIRSEFHS